LNTGEGEESGVQVLKALRKGRMEWQRKMQKKSFFSKRRNTNMH
jgi:ribosomal protein L28